MNRLIFLAVLLSLLSGCATDDYRPATHAQFLKTHALSIGQITVELTDTSRNRPVKMEIWYPTHDTTGENRSADYPFKLPPTSYNVEIEQGTHPLIMLSHGTGGNRISLMWLACELVANGYIVAAVDHFGNTMDNPIPKNFVEIWDRPLDISFALDYLLADSKYHESTERNPLRSIYCYGTCTGSGISGFFTGTNHHRSDIDYWRRK